MTRNRIGKLARRYANRRVCNKCSRRLWSRIDRLRRRISLGCQEPPWNCGSHFLHDYLSNCLRIVEETMTER